MSSRKFTFEGEKGDGFTRFIRNVTGHVKPDQHVVVTVTLRIKSGTDAFAVAVKKYRKKNRITQQAIADSGGVTRARIVQFEKGFGLGYTALERILFTHEIPITFPVEPQSMIRGMRFCKACEYVRNAQNISSYLAASSSGISQVDLLAFEKGYKPLSVPILELLCHTLGITIG